jgi:ABC-type amino acid transport substrate-binding protein
MCHWAVATELKILAVDEPPAAYIDVANKQNGYVLEIVKAMQQVLNNNAKILFVPEARALNIMADEPNTLLMSISRTASRELHFKWIAKVMDKKWEVYTLANANITIDSLQQLKSLSSIGVVRGDVREEWLVNENFKNLNSVTLHKQNIQMLELGRVDAIVYEKQGLLYQTNALGIAPEMFKSVFVLNQASVYLVMSKYSSPELVQQWQSAFTTIVQTGELNHISLRWQSILHSQFNIPSYIENNILVF